MRWKTRSFVVLVLGFAAIAAVLAVSCSVRENGGKQSSQCIRINAHGAAVFTDDGTWLATVNNDEWRGDRFLRTSEAILVCNSDNGDEFLKLEKSGQVFCDLFPVKGEDQLISLSIDRELGPQGTLELNYWDCTTGTPIRSATLDPEFGYRAENRFVVSPGGERIYLISELSPEQRKHMPAAVQSAGTLTCWELPMANQLFVIRDDAAPRPRLSSLVFTGDRSIMASICEPRMIVAWDAVTGKELHRFTEVDARQLAVNVDGTVLVGSTQDNVRCWNLRTGKETAAVPVKVPESKRRGAFAGDTADTAEAVGPSIVLSSDGRHLAVSDNRRVIETWDVATGSRTNRCELEAQVARGIADVAFSPDGTLLAAVGREFIGEGRGWRTYDAHVYVWKVASGELVHQSTLSRASGRGPHRLVFRGDGQRLMVVSEQDVHLCHLAVHKP